MKKNKPMAVPRRIPVGEANAPLTPPRTPKRTRDDTSTGSRKKQKVSDDKMVKARNEVMSGDKDTVKTNFSYVSLGGKGKENSKMTKLGVYTHVHNYACKITTDYSGSQALYSAKPTLAMENFCLPSNALGSLNTDIFCPQTNLNANAFSMSPTSYGPNISVNADGLPGTLPPTVGNAVNTRNYFYVKDQLVSVHLKNMFNLPARVTCYWTTPKKQTRLTPLQDFLSSEPDRAEITDAAALAQTSLTTLGTTFGDNIIGTPTSANRGDSRSNNSMLMLRGYKPTDFPEFKKKWKIIKKDIINLPSGGLMVHNVKFKYNKYFSQQFAETSTQEMYIPTPQTQATNNGPLLYPGLSIVPVFVFEGFLSQADVSEVNPDLPTFGNVDINIGFECRTRMNWCTYDVNTPKVTYRASTLLSRGKTAEEFISMIDTDQQGDPAS